jgi:two-component system, NarL family, nitrate/nitrite response regulator NarL
MPQRVSRIRVLIVIDVRLYREGLAATLRDHERLSVVATAGERVAALEGLRNEKPDLVIVDVALAGALGLMREIRAETPATRIVAFAVEEEISAILDCAEAGAAGFVTANASIEELVIALERVIEGELACSPRMAAELLRRAVARKEPPPQPAPSESGLTSRERQVLGCLQQGLSNKEIAAAMCIAEATVKNHVHRLLEKLQVSSRWRAASVARDSGPPARLGRAGDPRGADGSRPTEPMGSGVGSGLDSEHGLNPN